MMTKDEIRIHQKKLRDSLLPIEQVALGKALRIRLFQSEAYAQSKILFTYVSFRSEVDTKEIIHQAFQDKKRVYIPRIENRTIEFYEIYHMNDLILSKYGIPEPPKREETRYKYEQNPFEYPTGTEKILSTENLSCKQSDRLMLLPGLAFDSCGNRIGYGAGYYDRYLTMYPDMHFYKIALAFDCQVMDQIASDEYDRKADAILTPTSFIIC